MPPKKSQNQRKPEKPQDLKIPICNGVYTLNREQELDVYVCVTESRSPQKDDEGETRYTYSDDDIKGVIWQILDDKTYGSTYPTRYEKWKMVFMIDELRRNVTAVSKELEKELRLKGDRDQRSKRVQQLFGQYLQTVSDLDIDMDAKSQSIGKLSMTPRDVAILYAVSNLDPNRNRPDTVTIAVERLGIPDGYELRNFLKRLRMEPSFRFSKLGARLVRGSHKMEILDEINRLIKRIKERELAAAGDVDDKDDDEDDDDEDNDDEDDHPEGPKVVNVTESLGAMRLEAIAGFQDHRARVLGGNSATYSGQQSFYQDSGPSGAAGPHRLDQSQYQGGLSNLTPRPELTQAAGEACNAFFEQAPALQKQNPSKSSSSPSSGESGQPGPRPAKRAKMPDPASQKKADQRKKSTEKSQGRTKRDDEKSRKDTGKKQTGSGGRR